jgi:hypothetical protein
MKVFPLVENSNEKKTIYVVFASVTLRFSPANLEAETQTSLPDSVFLKEIINVNV